MFAGGWGGEEVGKSSSWSEIWGQFASSEGSHPLPFAFSCSCPLPPPPTPPCSPPHYVPSHLSLSRVFWGLALSRRAGTVPFPGRPTVMQAPPAVAKQNVPEPSPRTVLAPVPSPRRTQPWLPSHQAQPRTTAGTTQHHACRQRLAACLFDFVSFSQTVCVPSRFRYQIMSSCADAMHI